MAGQLKPNVAIPSRLVDGKETVSMRSDRLPIHQSLDITLQIVTNMISRAADGMDPGNSLSFRTLSFSYPRSLRPPTIHPISSSASDSGYYATTMADALTAPQYENQKHLDEHDDDRDPSISGLPSFDIGLSKTGDAGSHFRTENDPSNPWQRANVIERKSAVDIRCSCLDVVHGSLSASSDFFATLIVLQFRFDPRKVARRFQSVNIELEFKGMGFKETGPEVFAISPEGRMSLMPTTQHEDTKQNLNLQFGGAAPVGGITATGTVGWEKSVGRDTSDQTTVTGSIDLKGRNYGPSNCVSWTLLENKTTKTGVPTLMRTTILLKRKHEKAFQCVVKIDAKVDIRSTLERVFGGKGRAPRDDPVLFDPESGSTENLRKYNEEDLGAFDMESICDVTFMTTLGGVVKNKPQKGDSSS